MSAAIPPCTPVEGLDIEPCEPDRDGTITGSSGLTEVRQSAGGYPSPDFERLWKGPFRPSYYVPHMAVRATYLPDTVRCTAEFDNRWAGYAGPHPPDGEAMPMIHCFADVRVNEYIAGSGPSRLTLMVVSHAYPWEWKWTPRRAEGVAAHWEWALGWTRGARSVLHQTVEALPGREVVLFIGPSSNANIAVWEVFTTWNVESRYGEITIAHPYLRDFTDFSDGSVGKYPEEFRPSLPAFAEKLRTLRDSLIEDYEGRIWPMPQFPMIVSNIDHLDEFFASVGVTNQVQPPPVRVELDPEAQEAKRLQEPWDWDWDARERKAELGVEYPHVLGTHCGIDLTLFDGRYWEPIDLPWDLQGPNTPYRWTAYNYLLDSSAGTMALIGPDLARFTHVSGDQVYFIPQLPDEYMPGCI